LSDTPAHANERVIPSGTLEMVFNLRDDQFRIFDVTNGTCRRYSGAIVSGAYDRCFVIDTAEHASVVGVHFRPGGAFPVLGLPPGALASDHVDLEALWGPSARTLRDALCARRDSRSRFELLEAALTARLGRSVRRHPAVRAAIAGLERGVSVREVVAEVGLSHRRLLEVFREEVGIAPKLFGRIRRFQRATAAAQGATSLDWSRLAVECGYFDQSHLIRDFIAFSGLSPAELVRRSSPLVKDNHLPLL
jgi:AraC-like DNA-binding protein